MRSVRLAGWAALSLILSACATTQETVPETPPPVETVDPGLREPEPPANSEQVPAEPLDDYVIAVPQRVSPNPFSMLDGWETADLEPALQAFQRSCSDSLKEDSDNRLDDDLPEYGRHADWRQACKAASRATNPRPFFETFFTPLTLSTTESGEGLLTGYYEPEVEVRRTADPVYSEPILAVPESDAARRRPRAELNRTSARVIAYGRPVDVFFLQVQGSGRLHFDDGRVVRAAYAANNGHAYKSIGRVLIQRGELTREQSAKRNIEAWMDAAGPEAARALMNENPRYIFFSEQEIAPNEGPNGAARVPLTPMGSIAVDPRYHPYGTLAWLETRLPQHGRDYEGEPSGLLVVAQDTGSAIKGPLRGDLFFGPGATAGALAGVMKHPVRWTILVPKGVVEMMAPPDA